MAKVLSRTLNFSSNDLGTDVKLLLTFNNLKADDVLLKNSSPVWYRVISFGATGVYDATVEWQNQLAFIKPQENQKESISSSTHVGLSLGEKTTLEVSSPDSPAIYAFTKPVPGSNARTIGLTNEAGEKMPVAVGFINPDGTASPALFFPLLENNSKLVVELGSVLRGYISKAETEHQVLGDDIESTSVFNHDLAKLDATTNWVIQRDPMTGRFSVNRREADSRYHKVVEGLSAIGFRDRAEVCKVAVLVALLVAVVWHRR